MCSPGSTLFILDLGSSSEQNQTKNRTKSNEDVRFGSEIELTKKTFCSISFNDRTKSNLLVRLNSIEFD